MVQLSVNVNKIATLRNARGENQPNVLEAIKKLISYGVKSVTVHPRPDGRHILYSDVREIKNFLQKTPEIEFNVEGYPNKNFLKLMQEVLPNQCTLVPDPPRVLTSAKGWELEKHFQFLKSTIKKLKNLSIRVSLFVEPATFNDKELLAITKLAPDRAELYTKAYAEAFLTNQKNNITKTYKLVSQKIKSKGVTLNAGHDLNLNNLEWFLKNVPGI